MVAVRCYAARYQKVITRIGMEPTRETSSGPDRQQMPPEKRGKCAGRNRAPQKVSANVECSGEIHLISILFASLFLNLRSDNGLSINVWGENTPKNASNPKTPGLFGSGLYLMTLPNSGRIFIIPYPFQREYAGSPAVHPGFVPSK